MEQEIWVSVTKPIDLTGRYEISSFGNVASIARVSKLGNIKPKERVIRVLYDKARYQKVTVKHSGKNYHLSVHRLVALQFIANPNGKPQVNHIDGNKHNNNYLNLEWCTQPENIQHAQSIGLMRYAKPKIYKKKEEKKHTPPRKIINIETGEIFNSAEEVSKLIGITLHNFRRQVSGERYCYIPYRYLGREDIVRFKPVPLPKPIKTPFVRPVRKVYEPHPLPTKPVIMLDIHGNEAGTFKSIRQASEFTKTKFTTFRKWFKSTTTGYHKGYIFKYA